MNWQFWTRPASENLQETQTCDTLGVLLSVYADGLASPKEAQQVEAHLALCADCRESLTWMQATSRAVASRPVALPPADLKARIAEAIAAESARPALVPAAIRPRFALRPAYAAAASVSILGLMVGYGLLHQSFKPTGSPVPPSRTAVNPPSVEVSPSPAPTLVKPVPGVKPPTVAVLPPHSAPAAPSTKPAFRPLTASRVPGAVTPAAKAPTLPARPDPESVRTGILTATVPPPTAAPSSLAPRPLRVTPLKLHRPLVAFKPKPSPVAVETPPEERVATVSPPPTVPVAIQPAVVSPAEAAPVQVASRSNDLLGVVREHVGQMSKAGLASARQSVHEAAFVSSPLNGDKLPSVSITSGSFH